MGRDVLGVRNRDACAVFADLPAVEWALYGVLHDFTAEAKVRAQVRTVGIQKSRYAVFAPIQDEVLAEVLQRL